MFFRFSFVTLFLALLVLGTPVKRDAAQVESDIRTLTTKSQNLDTSIKAFPNTGATMQDAQAIHEAAASLVSATNSAANDVKRSPKFTETEATSITSLVAALVPNVKQTCSDLETKKAAVAGVNAKGIAEADLKSMKEAINTFGAQLLLKYPADKQSGGKDLFNEAMTALNAAIAAYA